jgi:hypothetical protein
VRTAVDAVERIVKPRIRLLFEREVLGLSGFVFGLAVGCVEAATRWVAAVTVVGAVVVGDAPGRGGSEDRHDAVRESKSQLFHAQMGASE